jgi:tetratricopeptide (TPR) repeat protein
MNLRLLFLLLLVPYFSNSQFEKELSVKKYLEQTDSLKGALKFANDEYSKFIILENLFWRTVYSNPALALTYAGQNLELSKRMDPVFQSSSMTTYGYGLSISGNYPQSLNYMLQAAKIAENANNKYIIRYAYGSLNEVYRDIGNFKQALFYSDKNRNYLTNNDSSEMIGWLIRRGGLFEQFNYLDSALIYAMKSYDLDIALYGVCEINSIPMIFGKIYAKKGDIKQAMSFYRQAIRMDIATCLYKDLMEIYNGMAKLFITMGYTDSAIFYAKQTLFLGRKTVYPLSILQGSTLLSEIYLSNHNADSAVKYLILTSEIKDTLLNQEKTRNIQNLAFEEEKKQRELAFEIKRKAQQIEIANLKSQNRLKISGLLVILLFIMVMWRNAMLKRKNETHLRELSESGFKLKIFQNENKIAELEMQALRAQMNPHFIFNSLNSINRFIMQNNQSQASEYLTKFSRLMRMILQNSQVALITLESELESLELYLEMEALRFNNHFSYKISSPVNLDILSLKIPPLIIQPYVENAIWHGLMHKENKGHLDIEINEEQNQLFIKIEDDGIGRKQAGMLSSKSATKHKSFGLKITAERIEMLRGPNGEKPSVIINDLVNTDGSGAGTVVIIKIPILYD